MAEEDERLLWKLKVSVRVKSFDLKVNLRNRFPCWKLHRFSFFIRFREHFLKLDSQSRPDSVSPKPKSKFRFLLRVFLLKFMRKWKRREREVQSQVDSKKFIEEKGKMDETLEMMRNRLLACHKKANEVIGGRVGWMCVTILILILILINFVLQRSVYAKSGHPRVKFYGLERCLNW